MKTLVYYFFGFIILFTGNLSRAQSFDYISPKDNSTLVSLSTNIILRSVKNVELTSLSTAEISVVGDKSGRHLGKIKLSDDNKTILFLPDVQFAPDENVNVTINPGIKTTDGEGFPSISFRFKTTPLSHLLTDNSSSQDEYGTSSPVYTYPIAKPDINTSVQDTLPANFPQITVGTSDNPADGNIFIANQSQTPNKTIGNYLMILNNDGSVVKYKQLPKSANLFKMEPNGDLSYNLKGSGARIIMDTSLTPIDTLQCGNGYSANGHDCLLLPNGHALLFANDTEPVDMSTVVPGGNPDALVTGVVVQEIDASKNVVFQWRSWDYLPITASYFDLTAKAIDLIHANALAVDRDGNILISMRHLSSIVKINRQTGNIDWILGGKLNMFSFINENESNSPTYFSYQHDISILPNGDITLFDNGNQHNPQYSRGVEYKLDEVNKTATLVWEYRHNPDIYSNAMGSVEKLSNGNTIIGWGIETGPGIPVFTEVHQDNSTALEFFLPSGQFSYRSYLYPWVSQKSSASVTSYEILDGNTYTFDNSTDTTGITITFNKLDADIYANALVSKYNYAPLNPAFSTNAPVMRSNYFKIVSEGINSYTGEIHVNLKYFPSVSNPAQTVVYSRTDSSAVFTPLSTSYDSSKNELIFTASSFGDFAFGVPQIISANPPSPISPKNGEIVDVETPVDFMWGTKGVVNNYRLQVSTDSTFNTTVADVSNLSSTIYELNTANNNSTYYWRVNNTNSAGTSNWSDVFKFNTASPFIMVSYPSGGEDIIRDSTYIIRWKSNVGDTVNINLIKNGNIIQVIADSVVSGTDAFLWQVPSDVPLDSSYKIQIASLTTPSLNALSAGTFSVEEGITGVTESSSRVKQFELYQNYPNPFNPVTDINYSVPKTSFVTIKVYDILGREIATLVNGDKSAGNYSVRFDGSNLSSGIYLYKMKATEDGSGYNFVQVKKFVLMK